MRGTLVFERWSQKERPQKVSWRGELLDVKLVGEFIDNLPEREGWKLRDRDAVHMDEHMVLMVFQKDVPRG